MTAALSSASSRGAAGRTIETTLVAVLTLVVLMTVLAVLVSGAATGDRAAGGGDTSTFVVPVASQDVGASAVNAASTAVVGTEDDVGFTVGELAAGEVSVEQFDTFWQAELDRIATAPCPAPTAPGTTVVVASIGATPPAHLGDAYVDYAPLLADARAEAAAPCT